MSNQRNDLPTIDQLLRAEGFEFLTVVYSNCFVKWMRSFLYEIERGKYADFKIVPCNIAQRNSHPQIRTNDHSIYVKYPKTK